MSSKANLTKAKAAKNDEFYTQISDIEKEVKHYKNHFKGKTIFLNCDDPEESNFWLYFSLNFEHLGLKKLIATHFREDQPSYKLEIMHDINGDGKVNGLDTIKTPLKQNGDFRSAESIEILKEADIVVTNPPFSLFREYIAQLVKFDKKFLVIGSFLASAYNEIFKLIANEKVWLGYKGKTSANFKVPGDNTMKGVSISWFTNLEHSKRKEERILFKKYKNNEKSYLKYDNYDAINVDKLKDIPLDYAGKMGVPMTILSHHNPDQFEIIDCIGRYSKLDGPTEETRGKFLSMVNGTAKFNRVIIKNKKLQKGA